MKVQELMKLTGMSRDAVKKCLQELIDAKMVVLLEDEYLAIPDFIDMINEANGVRSENGLPLLGE